MIHAIAVKLHTLYKELELCAPDESGYITLCDEIEAYNLKLAKELIDSVEIDESIMADVHNKMKAVSKSTVKFCSFADNKVAVTLEYTGHTYYGSPYETCDSCGTCDGAKCGTCLTKVIVEDEDLPVSNSVLGGRVIVRKVKDITEICEDLCKYLVARNKYNDVITMIKA